MKHIIIITALLFASPLFAARGEIEQQIRDTPEMSKSCKKHIDKNTDKVKKYTDRMAAARAKGKQPKFLDSVKLGFFEAELENWIEYCAPKETTK